MAMSTITTFPDVQTDRIEIRKPKRRPLRWLELACRARIIAIRRRHRRRAAIRALEALDDRMLRDIGIDRGAIWVLSPRAPGRPRDR
jgi:uncharacterized protein YjiS (DUF1127 family)